MVDTREDELEAVAFIGEVLGPLFLYDPTDAAIAPTYEMLAALDVGEAAQEWPLVDDDVAREALALMTGGIAEGVGDDVVWEYRRLFVGPGPKAAPPWGSVYTDRECVVFGEATLALRQWMRENGISRPGDGTEPEDHIGLMLLLLAWVARNRADLLDDYAAAHLLTWAPHFLEEMEAAAASPFFEGLAALTRASLAGVASARGLAVETPRFYR
ncbi:Tat proofreading chaperone DmsD [Adlercreutzia faecimuris]|uniref:Tat proofreading chaperone DmsD n=1 Tax=Adlercreutzia faecimuris TaxID=2897341 RepID=A0ABS9WHK3_9ACTN|nr:Tat proofreading chaperone DmsD [Adlercreutzia sp. JBNU-10]MCI2242351.1 Tat proofreading chaperone DmsD [Adlercreutzia sp. JBNU-10]